MAVGEQIVQVLFNIIFQYKRTGNFTAALAGGAGFIAFYIHLGLHALPGNLHEAKLADGQNTVAGTGGVYGGIQCLLQGFFFFGPRHIYKIYHNNTAQIPQPHLPRYFLCCFQVGL